MDSKRKKSQSFTGNLNEFFGNMSVSWPNDSQAYQINKVDGYGMFVSIYCVITGTSSCSLILLRTVQ